MGVEQGSKVGTIVGFDLTVPDAVAIRDFYASVVGWKPEPLDMGGYEDFGMTGPEGGEWLAGVVHARGENADLPPLWMAYIAVADLDESLRCCAGLGGTTIGGIRGGEVGARYCAIRDPAAAVLTLMQMGDA